MTATLVTDRRRFGLSVDELVGRAARAGADVIQVRERDLCDRELIALVRAMIRATQGTRTKILVNDRADIAIAAGAAGVHLRSDSAPGARVRAAFDASAEASAPPATECFLIGRSVHSLDDVDAAVAEGAYDYLMFGTVFRSAGKPADHAVAGLDGLTAACRRSPLPVIAIGGIDATHLDAVAKTGAAGFAGVGMFM